MSHRDQSEQPREPGVQRLLAVMRRLRDPEEGCPWDLEQTFSTIAPYTIEEAYEVADAIARADWEDLEGELGDLLLQVVYHAQLAAEAGLFDFETIAARIADKMVRRHPHVFGAVEIADAAAQRSAWEAVKAEERRLKAEVTGREPSLLDDVPTNLPAVTRALKLQRRAARVGFDWPNAQDVLCKLHEEVSELEAATASDNPDGEAEEIGDLLFTLVNLARHLDVDPEAALRTTNAKFERRFRKIERDLQLASRDVPPPLDALERAWEEAKLAEVADRTDQPRSLGR
jgi:nucleoside triphosphate diphosphatase